MNRYLIVININIVKILKDQKGTGVSRKYTGKVAILTLQNGNCFIDNRISQIKININRF